MKKISVLKAFSSVTSVILISKIMGFVKQMITASNFGATLETDLISLSEGFIGNAQYVLVHVLLTSVSSVYIYLKKDDELEAKRFAVDIGKAFGIISGAVVSLILLFAPALAKLIAPTYTQENSAALANYLRIFSPTLILFSMGAIFNAVLSANKRFIPGQLAGMIQSVILIICVLTLKPILGVNVLAVGFLAYVIVDTLFLGIVSKPYWKLSRGNPFSSAAVRQQLRMAGPLFVGYSMIYINQLVGKVLISGLETGSVTAMGYASVLSNLVSTIISSFCGILAPYITNRVVNTEEKKAADIVTRAANIMTLTFLPITILTVVCSVDVVTIVFGRGAFNTQNIQVAARALAGYAISFVPMVLRGLYGQIQYSYQNSKAPMINSSIGIVVNIILSIILCPLYGVWGVTFASSVSVIICGVLNVITARKCNSHLRFLPLLRSLPLMVIGGVACAAIAVWIQNASWANSPLLRFGLATVIGGIAYLLIVSPMLLRLLRNHKQKVSNPSNQEGTEAE